jgi:NTP pyrophosphatase (non-canonical NTP hydrolase)
MYLLLKINEEVDEVKQAHKQGDKRAVLEELGDVYEITLCLHKDRDDFCHQYPASKIV